MGKTRAFVVADAGPIIHLDELGCLDILYDFEQVSVPDTPCIGANRKRCIYVWNFATVYC